MANTVNLNQLRWDGYRGSLHYILSSDGTAISDTNLIDISTLAPAPTSIKIRTVDLKMYGNFILTFEIDATTDTTFEIFESQNATDVGTESIEFHRDYRDMPNKGWIETVANKAAAGFTGDLLVTSSGLASGDGFNLLVTFDFD